jgi:hypothetical protein
MLYIYCAQVAFAHEDMTAHLCMCKECSELMKQRAQQLQQHFVNCPVCGRPGTMITVFM